MTTEEIEVEAKRIAERRFSYNAGTLAEAIIALCGRVANGQRKVDAFTAEAMACGEDASTGRLKALNIASTIRAGGRRE